MTPTKGAVAELVGALDTIDGWLSEVDADVLIGIDEWHTSVGATGDILEVGVFRGRSAVLLGALRRAPERLVLCDPFAFDPDPMAVAALFRQVWSRFHDWSPQLIVAPSSTLRPQLAPSSFRLVHIDGGHDQEVVASDAQLAVELLGDGGVVVFDDIADPRWPGVPAGVWPIVASGALVPVCLTPQKLIAVRHAVDAPALRAELLNRVSEHPRGRVEATESLFGEDVPLIRLDPVAPPAPLWKRVGKRIVPSRARPFIRRFWTQ